MEGLNSCCCLLLLLFPVLQVPEGGKAGRQAKQRIWSTSLNGSTCWAGGGEHSGGVEVSRQWQTICPGWTGSKQPEHELEAAPANCICLEGCSRFWGLYMSTDTSSPVLLYLSHTHTPHSLTCSLTPEHWPCFSTDTWAALMYQCSDL